MRAHRDAPWVPQAIPVDVGSAMKKRAREVQHPVCIGLWEWIVWAAINSTPVQILFGNDLVDVCGVFAPTLRPQLEREAVTAIGCLATCFGLLPSSADDSHFPKVNHWVVGVPLLSKDVQCVASDWLVTVPRTCGGLDSSCESLAARSLRNGFSVHPTLLNGQCGIHAMSMYEAVFRAGRELGRGYEGRV